MNEQHENILAAIESDDRNELERLLSSCSDLNLRSPQEVCTLLMRAITCEDVKPEYIRLLLDAGADVTAQNAEGYTALHQFCFMGYMSSQEQVCEIAKHLRDAGAELEARTHWSWTPLMAVAMEGSIREFKALLSISCNPYVTYGKTSLPEFSRGLTLGEIVFSDPDKVRALVDSGYGYEKSIIAYGKKLISDAKRSTYPGKTPESEKGYVSGVKTSLKVVKKSFRQQRTAR